MFVCENGHEIHRALNILRDHGCGKCRIESYKFTLEMFKDIAAQNGGTCLSTKYVSCYCPLQFKCNEGHIFERTGFSIKSGKWCIICDGTSQLSVGEKCAHKTLEYIYKKKFCKARPNWLVNNEGNTIELDCYCEEVSTALEYNGKQHYVYTPYFHKSENDFKKIQEHDKIKIKECASRNINLIIVPYTVKYYDLYEYILSKCKNIPNDTPEEIDYKVLQIESNSKKKLNDIQLHLDENYPMYKVLSDTYIDQHTILEFKCAKNHIFSRSWCDINKGELNWLCKECRREPENSRMIPIINDFCIKNHVKLLDKYIDSKTSMKWLCLNCEEQHTGSWQKTLVKIKNDVKICYNCKKIDTIEKTMNDFCKINNLILLDKYKNSKTIANWKCLKCNIQFKKTWSDLRQHFKTCDSCNLLKNQ